MGMTRRHAICLVVDGLRASALGTYGNTTYPTPAFDSLASRSLVAEWMIADSPTLTGFYEAAWSGEHKLRSRYRDDSITPNHSLFDRLQLSGIEADLLSDDPTVVELANKFSLNQSHTFNQPEANSAREIEGTALGQFFVEAVEQLHDWHADSAEESSLLWIHSSGMSGPWDAPQSLREQLLDDNDPPAPKFCAAPRDLEASDDPDELLAYRNAYAAQVMVLDACLGAFLQSVEELYAKGEALVTIAGSRGFALGEHGRIGCDRPSFYGEQVHLPWLINPGNNDTPLPRYGGLSQPADIASTLFDWFNMTPKDEDSDGVSLISEMTGEAGKARQLAISVGENEQRAIRTPAWAMIAHQDVDGSNSRELYTKPDDRWESNDVSELCPEVVQELSAELEQFEQRARDRERLPRQLSNSDLIRVLR